MFDSELTTNAMISLSILVFVYFTVGNAKAARQALSSISCQMKNPRAGIVFLLTVFESFGRLCRRCEKGTRVPIVPLTKVKQGIPSLEF